MSIQSEALLATTGLFPADVTPDDHAHALTVPQAWQARLTAWLDSDQKPFPYLPPPDMEKLFVALAKPASQFEVDAWLGAGGVQLSDLGMEFHAALTKCREYVVAKWPKFELETLAGPKVLPLSFDDAHEMWSIFQVLDDPDRILDEMEARTLTPTQAEAFRVCYPDLYTFADEALRVAIAEKLVADPDWAPGWEWEAVLNTLRGKPPELLPPEPPPPPPPPETVADIAQRQQTQGQVSAKPKEADAR